MRPFAGKNKITEYMLPSLTAGGLFLMILAVNGLWPFGRDTLDYYDMAQQAVPFYYHNHDELWGLKSFVFDWYTNLGRVIPGLSEPSLFDLLFYFVPRRYILESMSILMLIKIMAAAFTMNLFIRYIREDLPASFKIILAAGYGMCGYVLANYTIPQWLDMAVIVPLVLMFSEKALKTGRIRGLAVTVFLISLEDYYFAIQMLTFIFLIGGAFCLIRQIAGRKTDSTGDIYVFRFALGIMTGIGLSAFSWAGDIAFNLTSARFENNTGDQGLAGLYLDLLRNTETGYISRWFSLMGLAFPAALALVGAIRHLKEKEYAKVSFWALCILMATAQLFLESIHLILHFGSYVNYPVRNGFMIYCIVAGIAAHAYDAKWHTAASEAGERMVGIAVGMALSVILVVLARRVYTGSAKISDHTVLLITMLFMVAASLVHTGLILAKKARYRGYCLCIWILELLFFGMIMIGKPLYQTEYGSDPEQEGEFIRISNSLVDKLGAGLSTEDDRICRIKNPDTSLNTNYGMIMRRGTLCGWTSFASPDEIKGAVSLGYGSQYTRILDSGGDIFSDTLLHIRQVISCEEADEKLYRKVASATVPIDHMTGESATYGLYENVFEFPFAIPVKDAGCFAESYENAADHINAYCRAFGGQDIASLIEVEPERITRDGHEISKYRIHAGEGVTLYFRGECTDTEYKNTTIAVNGKLLDIPTIKEKENHLFPAHFNNNTIALGTFSDEDIEVITDMDMSDPDAVYDHYLYQIDTKGLGKLCGSLKSDGKTLSGKRSLDIDPSGGAAGIEGYLIPVPYDSGWSAYVDGQKTQIQGINGLFMYVPAKDAKHIHMSYYPEMMTPGLIAAAICLLIILWTGWRDKKKKPAAGVADTLLSYAYMAAFVAAFAAIYVMPVVFAVAGLTGGPHN